MTLNQKFHSPVINNNGYVVLTPNVGYGEDLLQSYPVNPYAESLYQQFPLGTKAIQGERAFRYCKNGTVALNIAAPIQQAKPAHAEQDDDIVCGASAAIGATEIYLTSTTNLDASPNGTDNDFAEGYVIVNDAGGEGQMYKIKANEGFATTALSKFTLYDPLTIALTITTTELGLIRNPYYKVLATEAVVSGMPIGVPLIAVTASYWFWAQTGGPAPVVCNAAIALGTPCVVGVTAALVDPIVMNTTKTMIIGYMMTPGVASTEKAICFLTLDT